jgi:fucose 4-O-acetylase-like acetyltransferase
MTTSTRLHATDLAVETPADRNRYLDFLRVLALFVVVYGHFLMAAVMVEGGSMTVENALSGREWLQWTTWALQVMPLFFIVGGFVNATSWESSQRRGEGYGTWVGSRTRRLVAPAIAFVTVWSIAALVLAGSGIDPSYVALGSQVVAVPVWFLSVYLLVIVLAPATYRLHRRFGIWSLATMVAGALTVDVLVPTFPALGWLNYVLVWAAIHQLGYLWKDGVFSHRFAGPALGLGAFAVLLAMVISGPYAIAMVGVDGANNGPPNVALFVLGLMQLGLARTGEPAMHRYLARPKPWTAVIAANGLAMTVYLWHMTALVAMVMTGLLFDNPLLSVEPMTVTWWATRPLWFAILTIAMAPLVVVFRRFDRLEGRSSSPVTAPVALLAAASASVAFAAFASQGFHPTTGFNLTAAGAFGLAVACLRYAAGHRQPGTLLA